MTPFVSDSDFTLFVGDVRDVLVGLPAGSVDCCVTSPPYWGLRDYGTGTWDGGDPACDHAVRADPHVESSTLGGGKATTGHSREGFKGECPRCGATRVDQQIGLEPTPNAYVEALVGVFREVRRVLADTGTLWLNLGDSYNNRNMSRTSSHQGGLGFDSPDLQKSWVELKAEGRTRMAIEDGDLKKKDLVGIPWLVAFALRADGWYLRSDIVWAKPNPMPESVTDRPTKAHEYVFLLSKQPRYYFDQEAVREKFETVPQGRRTSTAEQPKGAGRAAAGIQNPVVQGGPHVRRAPQEESLMEDALSSGSKTKTRTVRPGIDTHGGGQGSGAISYALDGRNVRSVWEIATQPYAEAHFATFPEELPRRCIGAGCPEQVCAICGKPRERIVERTRTLDGQPVVSGGWATDDAGRIGADGVGHWRKATESETLGWSDCGHSNYRPGVVLDPFMGSGTTALVARKLARRSIGIELNPEYAALCARRLQQLSLLA